MNENYMHLNKYVIIRTDEKSSEIKFDINGRLTVFYL